MSLRPFTRISIQQTPTKQWANRKLDFDIDFVHEYEIQKGWDCHTDIGKILLPKNIVVKSGDYFFQQRGVFNVILGGAGYVGEGFNVDPTGNSNTNPPLIMKGDVVHLFDGYIFRNAQNQDVFVQTKRFSGYVSRVSSTVPIEIHLEDNFYLLKCTPVNKTVFSGKLVDLCKYLLEQTNGLFGANAAYKRARLVDYELQTGVPIYDGENLYPKLTFTNDVDELTADFSLGHLDIGTGLSVSQLLSRLKGSFGLDSFFVGDELHFGFPTYNESRANNDNVFEFQNNISDHSLEYKNKDDIVLSAIVSCQVIKKTGRHTKDGAESTKKEKLSVMVYWDIPTQDFKFIEKNKGEPFPSNEGGERHEFVYCLEAGQTITASKLGEWGINKLKPYFYNGFRGSFTTIGYPFVEWNDNVVLLDTVITDRNGIYKVKKVVYKGGLKGLKQEVFLDYKLNIPFPDLSNAIRISML